MMVKVPNLVQMRLISYDIQNKNGNFPVCGRISLCLFHTCIHFLHIRQDSVQLKILKGDVDLPN